MFYIIDLMLVVKLKRNKIDIFVNHEIFIICYLTFQISNQALVVSFIKPISLLISKSISTFTAKKSRWKQIFWKKNDETYLFPRSHNLTSNLLRSYPTVMEKIHWKKLHYFCLYPINFIFTYRQSIWLKCHFQSKCIVWNLTHSSKR